MRNRTLLPRSVCVDDRLPPEPTPAFSVCPLYADGMVLPRDRRNTVWGRAPAGATVTVTLDRQRQRTTADGDGTWRAELEPVPAGGPHELTVRCGAEVRVARDVLAGDVWLCAGQSNMEWPLHHVLNAEAEIAAADDPGLRFLQVTQQASATPVDSLPAADRWHGCDPVTARWASGVGFFFGRALRRELGVPIGLIDNSYGGTCAEAWTSLEAIAAQPALRPVLDRYATAAAEPERGRRLDDWRRDAAEWNRLPADEQTQWPVMLTWWRRVRPPLGHPRCVDSPGGLYNGMVHPLLPFGIRGVIWYQGESNIGRAGEYRTLLPALIGDWRRRWGQGDLPFLVVQLANGGVPATVPGPSQTAELREAQLVTARSTPGVGLAVTIDVGAPDVPHPPDKQPVGHRLALAALRLAYGRDVVHSGPTYERMVREGDRLRLFFSDLGGGLATRDGGPLRHVAVVGADGRSAWAEARLDGDTIVVSGPAVAHPLAVRYAWSDNPDGCNLVNRAGLPASPFRTDTAAG